jgi:hypothetical protein
VVWDGEMNGLVRDEVAEYELRREDESPVEREVSPGRAVAPLRALTHQIDPLSALSKACGDDGEVVLYLCSRLPPQPVLEAACRRGLRPRSPPHDDFTIDEVDNVLSRSRPRRLNAHLPRLPTKENLANPALRGPPHAAKTRYALELIENPPLVALQKD